MQELTIDPPKRGIRRTPNTARLLRDAGWCAVLAGAAVAALGLLAGFSSIGPIRTAYLVGLGYGAVAAALAGVHAHLFLRGHDARRDAAREWIGDALRELGRQTEGSNDGSSAIVRPKRTTSLIALEVRRTIERPRQVLVHATPAVLPRASLSESLSAADGMPLSDYLDDLDADVDRARRTNAALATALAGTLLLVLQVMARLAERAG